MPTKHDRRTRRDLGLILGIVAAGATIISVVGSSASPTADKVASSAFPKPAAVEATAEAPPPSAASVDPQAATAAPAPPAAADAAETTTSAAPAAPRSTVDALPPIQAPQPAPDLPGYDVPASIDATGASDVTTELLAFIASVPDGSVIRFPAGATYRAEGSLKIENRNNLVFEGNGSTIVADSQADRKRRHWWFLGGSNITIRDLNVRGANPNAGTGGAAYVASLEAQHGFDFGGVEGVLLERVRITDVYGDFVYLGAHAGRPARSIVIQDSHFERNGRQGVAITGAADVLITRNFIGETRRATFDIEPNSPRGGAWNVQIIDNRIGPGRLLLLAAEGNPLGTIADVTIQGNELSGRALNISVKGATDQPESRRLNFRVLDNHSDASWGNNGGGLMTFSGVDGVEIIGNTQRLQAGRGNVGVDTYESCRVQVHSNEAPGGAGELRQDGSVCPWP